MASGGDNVLWQLAADAHGGSLAETDSGYHHGADISMLSQFAGEDEVLFPPCTILEVHVRAGKVKAASCQELSRASFGANPSSEQAPDGTTKTFTQIRALPTFV